MRNLVQFLRDRAPDGLLPLADQAEAAGLFGLTLAQVEETALGNSILPVRYQRNRETISIDQQLALFRSRVAVVGCGGLGGYVIEELARLGIGVIVAVDPDVFEEHNLNRQLFATPDLVGQKKAEAAARRVATINPAVTCLPVAEAFARHNGDELLRGVDVAVDGLDSIPARLLLADRCDARSIPLVHGTIAGWYGRVATQFPGDGTMRRLYPRNHELPGIESRQGNPAFTPAVIASLQVAEVAKLVLHVGEPLRNRCLDVDLYHFEVEEVSLKEDQA
ncbi:MAG: HesA/MoeB/ThiF family protein [Desulfobulbaceae bacterium]|nr:HesA/MoeB/ThiF family protein [Desulfobulbaceae bacterium]MDY0349634.1 HesA/MoeB/ThiF family protein [Desulfobulbaceae bacterium]